MCTSLPHYDFQVQCSIRHRYKSIFLRYSQQDVTFLNLFISITLYMFRVESPPIIRSSDCTYTFWYLSNFAATFCYHGWVGTLDKYQKPYVQSELLMRGGVSTRNMYSVIEIVKGCGGCCPNHQHHHLKMVSAATTLDNTMTCI
jgi:hypothetical protein